MALSSSESNGILLASAARTATVSSEDMNNDKGYRGIYIRIDCSVFTAGAVITPTLRWFDPAGQEWVTIETMTEAVIAAAAAYTWLIYPIGSAVTPTPTHQHVGAMPAGIWRLTMTHADTKTCTYSVGYTYLN